MNQLEEKVETEEMEQQLTSSTVETTIEMNELEELKKELKSIDVYLNESTSYL